MSAARMFMMATHTAVTRRSCHRVCQTLRKRYPRWARRSGPYLVGPKIETADGVSEDPSGASAERRRSDSRAAMRLRIRGEFEELGGMSLTLPQAARLFYLAPELCERLLNELVAEGVLRRTDSGSYARAF